MKNILKYLDFINEEVKQSDLQYFLEPQVSNKFTCSIEIELETLDKEGTDQDYTDTYVDKICQKIENSVRKELMRIDNFKISKELNDFIDLILNEVRNEIDDYDYLIDEILETEFYSEDEYKSVVVEMVKQQVLTYFFSDNFEYLENKFKIHLPNFHKKYKNIIKFELDNTLDRGIEISNRTYFSSIDELITLIKDFYIDFKSQSYWLFNERTGIHINLGLKGKSTYNPIKGLLFLNDFGKSPFVFKNMEWRKNSKFCNSLLSRLKEKDVINECNFLLKQNDLFTCEKILNDKLFFILNEDGYKNFGVNLKPLNNFNYIEFRYIGGDIKEDVIIDKLLYFSFIIHQMTNDDFKRKDYLKKLYAFLNKKTTTQ